MTLTNLEETSSLDGFGMGESVKRDLEKKLLKVSDPVDRQLFFTSTCIQIGNGKNTPF
jgi:hypothetical protein